ncbi:MAG: phosphoribosylaminoimidazolesuccinocarboxamide synthase [Halobacteriales archaeon]
MTSVKEFRVDRPATDRDLGRGAFVFTDDYSVFDWGKMPDEIPDKGASLCVMGAFNFELLEDAGVPTHYEGVVSPGGDDPVPLDAADEPPHEMAIALTRVPDLPFVGDADGNRVHNGYDYGAYHGEAGDNYLVPLEVVFRNRVPVGSSLRKRSEPGDHGLDMDGWPDDPVDLPEPVVEFSTKYEKQDRYLSREEADAVAGTALVDDLESLAREVNRVVTERAEAAGFVHQDGKIEVLSDDGELRVADVVGTFDENRFSRDGQQVSKEVLRQYHRRTQPEWVDAVAAAKREADERGIADWKALCGREPEPLPESVVGVARDLYAAGTNAYTGEAWFDAPSIGDAVAAARDL